MKRKTRYLVGGIISLAKPFFIGTIVVGIGLSDSGGFASSFLRYLIFPQLIPAVCLLFLYFDEEKYMVFRPLAMLLAGISLILLAACGIPLVQNPQKIVLITKNLAGLSRSSLAFFAALLTDLIDLVILLSHRQKQDVEADRIEHADPGHDILPRKEQ